MFEEVKREVAIGNRVLSHIGLADGVTLSLGHVSMRVPDDEDRFVVKGRGYEVDALAAMTTDDMVVCDLDGAKVDGRHGVTQCYEVKIHSAIYRNHPEIQSVVHVHPRYTILMSLLGVTLVPMCNEGSQLVRTPVPVWPHSRLVSSDEDGEGVAAIIGGVPGVATLLGHGAVSTGLSISQSISNVFLLEEQARMNYLAFAACGREYSGIPDALLQEARSLPGFWELPHFQSSVPAGTTENPHRLNSSQSGPYRYWSSLVSSGV
jgi:ribulose-5-phosphate 4-epimerase/fuculose-1-phosphate aldolase